MVFWDWVQVVGYLAEGVGVGLAAWEIRERGRQLAAFEGKYLELRAGESTSSIDMQSAVIKVDYTPPPQTLEQRFDSLERHVMESLPNRFRAVARGANVAAEAQTRRILRPVEAALSADLAKLMTAMRGTLSGHRRAQASLIMLSSGLLLQAVGSLAGSS